MSVIDIHIFLKAILLPLLPGFIITNMGETKGTRMKLLALKIDSHLVA